MQILELDHLQLAMPAGTENQARAFYGGLLGFQECAKPEALAMRGGCWFQCGPIQLHLGVETPFAPAHKAHPAFVVADIAAARASLEQAGVATTADDSVAGVRRFYAADPFGNRLEFIQNGDGFNSASDARHTR